MAATRPAFLTTRPPTLVGRDVILRPLSRRDAAQLARVPAADPAWALLLRHPTAHGADPGEWLAEALRAVRAGREYCWTIRDRLDGQLLGSTRYLNLDLPNRRVEVGATWLLPEARGTSANAESKLLQLDHAFDVLGVERVHVQADVRNGRSRAAIEALGATFEGVLRRHLVLRDGTSRDTAVYSILADEWPRLRPALAERAERRSAAWRARDCSLDTSSTTRPLTGFGIADVATAAM